MKSFSRIMFFEQSHKAYKKHCYVTLCYPKLRCRHSPFLPEILPYVHLVQWKARAKKFTHKNINLLNIGSVIGKERLTWI